MFSTLLIRLHDLKTRRKPLSVAGDTDILTELKSGKLNPQSNKQSKFGFPKVCFNSDKKYERKVWTSNRLRIKGWIIQRDEKKRLEGCIRERVKL